MKIVIQSHEVVLSERDKMMQKLIALMYQQGRSNERYAKRINELANKIRVIERKIKP